MFETIIQHLVILFTSFSIGVGGVHLLPHNGVLMFPAIQLTEEEINELLQTVDSTPTASNGRLWSKGYSMYDYEYSTPKSYVRHEWVPILLLNSTVYNCKKCGAHQEKTIGVYCEDETF